MKKPSDKPDTVKNSILSVSEAVMLDQETKDPKLADKQRRLIETLKEGFSAKQPVDSSSSATTAPPPKR